MSSTDVENGLGQFTDRLRELTTCLLTLSDRQDYLSVSLYQVLKNSLT